MTSTAVLFWTNNDGIRVVTLPETDYNALRAQADEAADREIAQAYFEAKRSGADVTGLTAERVKRMLGGESKIRLWREQRRLTVTKLASMAGISQAYLSQIENGRRKGTVEQLKSLAGALGLIIDDLV